MDEIARGAEAIIYEHDGKIVKLRTSKSYRIPELDTELRRQRTKREANVLQKAPVRHPTLLHSDGKESISMEKIEGPKLREVLDSRPELARQVGEMAAALHNADIIHGDLTTSNMILATSDQIFFIDFGLSMSSTKVEDKAVDLHLFKQALNSKHHKVYEEALGFFLEGYGGAKGFDQIMERLAEVELRGRYRKG